MKVALIIGSVRRDRHGTKVGRWMEEKLKSRGQCTSNPLELDLPLLDRMYKEMSDPPEKIKGAEGYVAIKGI